MLSKGLQNYTNLQHKFLLMGSLNVFVFVVVVFFVFFFVFVITFFGQLSLLITLITNRAVKGQLKMAKTKEMANNPIFYVWQTDTKLRWGSEKLCWGNEAICWGNEANCWGNEAICWGNEANLMGK